MRRRTSIALVVVLIVVGLLAAACGGKIVAPLPSKPTVGTLPTVTKVTLPAAYKGGDPTAGKQVFLSAGCTGCHTLKDANATGTVGPNLDQSKPPATKVFQRVTEGRGAMPSFKGKLTTKQIADVIAYVTKATGGNANG